ncbi:MAG: glycosyltransferase family 39 protein [Candidatus Hydrogenedentota bacterium]|nr:MAG: glycosyltransferase family 39 protein [Candidatus Hydrogenedentota bacterium]
MNGKTKGNLALLTVTAYCALSWILMRLDYFAQGEEIPVTRQFVHLAFTVGVLLIVTFWKGNVIESFIARLAALPTHQQAVLFVVAGVAVLTMSSYPRNRMAFSMLTWGLMESTRTLVEGLFLAGATVGVAWMTVANAREASARLLRLAERLIFNSSRSAFLMAVTLIVLLETNAISLFQFHHVPVCSDEVNYIFQAKIFASGRLYAQPPRHPEFFDFLSFVLKDKWYSIVPPGFPLILTLGVLLGATWIVNPILAALCAMLVYLTAREIFDERIARGSAALMVVSPFFLMLSSTHLSHISTAFFFMLFLYLYVRGLDRPSWTRFILAGLALGAMVLVRPLTGLAASIPWGAYTLWLLATRRTHLIHAVALALGVTIPVALLLGYNYATTGDPLLFGYTVRYGEGCRLGFVQPPQELVFARHKHTPFRGIVNVNNGFYYLNRYLLGWSLPSLLFAMVPFALPSKNKWDYLLLAHLISIPAAYFFFFHQDFMMGPRYYFSVIPAAVILTARGVGKAPELWSRLAAPAHNDARSSHFLALLIAVCTLFNFTYFFPTVLQYYRISSPVHQGVPAPIWRFVESRRISNAVIFISEFPFSLTYGAGLWRNDPDLRGDIIYARDRGSDNVKLMEQYPGRKYYLYRPFSENFEEIFPDEGFRTVPTSLPG